MRRVSTIHATRVLIPALLVAAWAADASADAIADWNVRSGDILVDSRLGTPPAVRVMAIVQTAAYEAVNAITRRYPASRLPGEPAQGASVDAAVAAAHRATLLKLVPSQHASIDAAYQAALGAIPESPERVAGIAIGEKAAAAVLALRADDGAAAAEAYRPHTTPGAYVPTVVPAVPGWNQRRPWLMASPAQFRPGPPPALTSETWSRDYDEVKALGARNSSRRSSGQTEVARFWEFSLPSIYFGVVRSVADSPGRDVTRNARLLAAAAQAMDDAMIGVFDAKYHYNFWRPATAIRNGDIDGNDATERDPSWAPLIDTPMHPEYPCAHCILAATVGTVLEADVGDAPAQTLSTTSPTARGAVRRWTSIGDLVQEVANARIYDGVHYRNSTEVGVTMGRSIGRLAASKLKENPR